MLASIKRISRYRRLFLEWFNHMMDMDANGVNIPFVIFIQHSDRSQLFEGRPAVGALEMHPFL
jgi:hypothetical protein